MQSKSTAEPSRGWNVNQPRVTWKPIALLWLRLTEIFDTVRTQCHLYQLLKHLKSSLLLLLNIFNKIWISGDFPSDWRKAIIPVPKPGKDPTNPTNYRPIVLTSCISKTMERMISLKSHHLFINVQFKSRHSTFCREAFIHNHNLVSVWFLLFQKADRKE